MSGNDEFLYALKDDLPQDFAEDLRQQLRDIEKEESVERSKQNRRPQKYNGWVLAVASIATVFFGTVMLLVSASRIDVLGLINTLPEETLAIVPITVDNIQEADVIASYGKGHSYRMALSPDDGTLAVGSGNGIYLHDANNLNAEARFIGEPGRGIFYLEYADNGDLYALSWNHTETLGVYRWDGNEFNLLYEVESRSLQTIDLSPDGNRLMITICDGDGFYFTSLASILGCANLSIAHIRIIDLSQPENTIEITLENSGNVTTSMSPDWSQLAYYDEGFITLYDMETGTTRQVVEADLQSVQNSYPVPGHPGVLKFTPDGSQLGFMSLVSDYFQSWSLEELNRVDDQLLIITVESGRVIDDTIHSHLIFRPGSNEHLVNVDHSVVIYDADNYSQIGEFQSTGEVRQMFLNSDGSLLYVMSSTGTVQSIDWQTGETVEVNLDYGVGFNNPLTFSNDGSHFVNTSFRYQGGISFLWDISNNELEAVPVAGENNLTLPINYTAISPDERYVAYVITDTLYLSDRVEGQNQSFYALENVRHMAFREDGQLIVMSVENDTSGRGHIYSITAEMLENGVIEDSLEYVVIDDIRFGYDPYSPSVISTLIPDQNILAVFQCDARVEFIMKNTNCTQHLIKLIDTVTGEILLEFSAPMGITYISMGLTQSSDGEYLVMGTCERFGSSFFECRDGSGVIDIWKIDDLLAGNTEALRVSDIELTREGINLIANEDGSFMLTTINWHFNDEDGYETSEPYIYFWSVSVDGEAEQVYQLHAGSLEFSPDLQRMVTLLDGQFHLWVVPEEAIISAED